MFFWGTDITDLNNKQQTNKEKWGWTCGSFFESDNDDNGDDNDDNDDDDGRKFV